MLSKRLKNLSSSSLIYAIPQLVGLIGGVIGIGHSVASLKLESGLYRYHSEYEGSSKREFLGTLFITKTLLGLVVAIFSFALFAFLYSIDYGFANLPFFPFIPAASIIIFLLSSSGFLLALYVAEEKPKVHTVIQVISFFAVNFMALFFVIYSEDGVWGRFKAMLIIELVIFLFMSYLSIKKIDFQFKKRYFVRSIKFSLPLYLSDFVNLIYAYTDRLVLPIFEDISKLGLLYVADKIGVTIHSAFRAFEKSVMPYIFNEQDSDIQKNALENLFVIWCSLSSLILLLFLLLSEVFIKVLLDVKFQDPSIFFATKILGLSYFLTTIYPFFSIAIGIAEETKYILKVTSLSAFINFLMNITFIPLYGWLAAPFTTLICCMITFIYLGYFSAKKTKIKFNFQYAFLITCISLITYYLLNFLFLEFSFEYIIYKIILGTIILLFVMFKMLNLMTYIERIK